MRRLVALLGLTALVAAAGASAAVPQHRIGVRVVAGDGEFFDRRTGATFVPRGTTTSATQRSATRCSRPASRTSPSASARRSAPSTEPRW